MSERDGYSVSNRSLLANASVNDIKDSYEKALLIRHHFICEKILKQQEKFREVQERLRKTTEEINACDPDLKNQLQEAAREITSEADSLDRQLIELEKNSALQKVLEREKAKLREESNQRGKEALEAYRERELQHQQELAARYQEKRQKVLQNREQATESVSEPIIEIVTEEPKDENLIKKLQMINQEAKYVYIQFFLRSLSLTLPLIMLEAPIWVICLVTFIIFSPLLFMSFLYAGLVSCLYDIIRPILYICGLIVAIEEYQDFFAIAFYILLGLQAINIIKRFIGTVCTFILIFTNSKE